MSEYEEWGMWMYLVAMYDGMNGYDGWVVMLVKGIIGMSGVGG